MIMRSHLPSSLRLVVRTSPSHGGNMGSNPIGSATKISKRGFMKKLILIPFLFISTHVFAHQLHHFSDLKKALAKGHLIRIAVDFAACSASEKGSPSFHLGLFTPNAIQVMDSRIVTSLTHFTIGNAKFPDLPIYEFIKYTLTDNDNLNLSHQILDARNYSALSEKFSMDCKIGAGVKIYD